MHLPHSRKLRILVFDSWSKGRHHVDRFVKPLFELGHVVTLVHIGSWGHDVDSGSFDERFYSVRDISSFGSSGGFSEVLSSERPDLVIFLSTRSLAHQAFNLTCRVKDIPTWHFYHGIVSIRDFSVDGRDFVPIYQRINIFCNAFWRNVRYVIPNFLKASWHYGELNTGILILAMEVVNKFLNLSQNSVAPEFCRTNYGCVYIEKDKDHMEWCYGVERKNIYVVGCPDFIEYEESSVQSLAIPEVMDATGDVFYIETGIAASKKYFSNVDSYIDFLVRLNTNLAQQNYRLRVKCHPSSEMIGLREMLVSAGVSVLSSESFYRELDSASFILGERSSLLLTCALASKPIGLMNAEELSFMKYGKLICDYPLSYSVSRIDAFSEILPPIDFYGRESIIAANAWVSDNCGPFPSKDYAVRILAALQDDCFERIGNSIVNGN